MKNSLGSHRLLSTINPKRKLMINGEQHEASANNQRERRKFVQRNANSNHGNGKKLRINNDVSTIKGDETTYCLCSQVLKYKHFLFVDTVFFPL